MRLLDFVKHVRLIPFDVSDSKGREKERYRLAALAAVTNLTSKVISTGVMIFAVSMTTPYLGEERFGVWMTIASLVGLLTFMDIGAGNALTNRVAHVSASDSREQLREVITGGLGLLLLISVIAVAILACAVYLIPLATLFKLKAESVHLELEGALYAFAILYGLNLFSNSVHRVFAGLQRSFEAHGASIVGSLISLVAIAFAAHNQQGLSVLLICSMAGSIVSGMILFGVLIKKSLLSIGDIGLAARREYRHLIKSSGLFFILQLGTMIGWGMDGLLISSTLGVGAVAAYALVQRMFQIVTQPISILNAPLWSAYADAHARGEKSFIRKTLRNSIRNTFLYTGVTVSMLVASGEGLISMWTSGEIRAETTLIFTFGVWAIIEALGNALAMFLNGCNVIRQQVIAVIFLCSLALPIKIFLLANYGIAAMIAGFTIVYVLNFSILYGFIFRRDIATKLS